MNSCSTEFPTNFDDENLQDYSSKQTDTVCFYLDPKVMTHTCIYRYSHASKRSVDGYSHASKRSVEVYTTLHPFHSQLLDVCCMAMINQVCEKTSARRRVPMVCAKEKYFG